MYELAIYMANGLGGAKNEAAARAWYVRAADMGHIGAME
ncbi:SEL1-like repeat protein, partial [Serratia marcescens]